ncbi:MAG: hypothetical protein ACWGKN_12480 [Desulfoprunum sp.]
MLQCAKAGVIPREKILYVACDHPAIVDIGLYYPAQIRCQEGGRLLLVDQVHKSKRFFLCLEEDPRHFQPAGDFFKAHRPCALTINSPTFWAGL